MHHV
jgi:hypothetical protein